MKMNKKGFTLAELLIVVAIIGVLTVVAVPIFTTQLEKAREETDIANMREAKAAAVAAYLGEETIGSKKLGPTQTASVDIHFDANAGTLVEAAPTIGYGRGTGTDGKAEELFGYDTETAVNDQVIKVTVDTDGDVTLSWVAKGTGTVEEEEEEES